jgi:anthranilate phosphoribosyltransferase
MMNILGPLANPAGAGRQVVGVAEPARMPLLAGALAALGSAHALVVHGDPGMDEISPLGCTRVMEVRDSAVHEWTIDPDRLGLAASEGEIAGGSPADNARVILDVLEGRDRGGARTAVVLNAAAALYVAGLADRFDDALTAASDALDAGKGMAALERLRACGRE